MADCPDHPELQRAVGHLQPTDARAARALKALAERRIKDAQSNVDAIADVPPINLAWKHYLQGAVCLRRAQRTAALDAFTDATYTALKAATGAAIPQDIPMNEGALATAPGNQVDDSRKPPANSCAPEDHGTCIRESAESAFSTDALRLAAMGFERIGQVRRRQDRPQAATRAHQAAYALRWDHGSFEETWESALSLGIDAELAGDHNAAQKWYRSAVKIGAKATHHPNQKQAEAWTRLADLLRKMGSHADAVEAARTARDCWRKHDLGSVDAARADLHLGRALMALGESLHGQDPSASRTALCEALVWLTSAGESLQAFGPATTPDVQWCADQIDFTNRLLSALG